MAQIWKEPKTKYNDSNLMWNDDDSATDISSEQRLEWIYYVQVCGFKFKFCSVNQIQAALDYYSQKVHPSSRIHFPNSEQLILKSHRYQLQRWHERLPSYLRKENKRKQVVKALEKALEKFSHNTPLSPIVSNTPNTSLNKSDRQQILSGFLQCKQCQVIVSALVHFSEDESTNVSLPLKQGECLIIQNQNPNWDNQKGDYIINIKDLVTEPRRNYSKEFTRNSKPLKIKCFNGHYIGSSYFLPWENLKPRNVRNLKRNISKYANWFPIFRRICILDCRFINEVEYTNKIVVYSSEPTHLFYKTGIKVRINLTRHSKHGSIGEILTCSHKADFPSKFTDVLINEEFYKLKPTDLEILDKN